jgi:bifunctional non-homologous end joining protein LigD
MLPSCRRLWCPLAPTRLASRHSSRKPPTGPDWLHEIKWDGYRFVCHLNGVKVRMMTRNALDWSTNFPAIVDALTKLPAKSAIVDGEAAILDYKGRVAFRKFAASVRKGGGKAREAVLYAFNLLALDGADLRRSPSRHRRSSSKSPSASPGRPGKCKNRNL